MKLLYIYMSSGQDGSRVHIDGFMHAFVAIGGEIVDGGATMPVFTEDKSTWSLLKKFQVKAIWIGSNLKDCCRTLSLALRAKPDAVVVRLLADHRLFLAIAVLSLLYPVIVEVNALRSSDEPRASTRMIALFDRWSLRLARRMFVVSTVLRDQLVRSAGVEPRRIAVIENGVDPALFDPTMSSAAAKQTLGLNEAFVVGFTGSCKKWHGIQHLLHLAKACAEDPLDIRFLIVGVGAERKALDRYVTEQHLTARVRFTGQVPHDRIPRYLQAMDVALAPYSSDSFAESAGFHCSPLKIFEYMAAAKAIIAAPVGQVNELLLDGESGRLLPSEDTNALKNEILRLYADPQYRLRLGRNARRRM
jgi:glycosyltransferase involved in cell wall biosynthesis